MRIWFRKNDVRVYLRMNVRVVEDECESIVEDE